MENKCRSCPKCKSKIEVKGKENCTTCANPPDSMKNSDSNYPSSLEEESSVPVSTCSSEDSVLVYDLGQNTDHGHDTEHRHDQDHDTDQGHDTEHRHEQDHKQDTEHDMVTDQGQDFSPDHDQERKNSSLKTDQGQVKDLGKDTDLEQTNDMIEDTDLENEISKSDNARKEVSAVSVADASLSRASILHSVTTTCGMSDDQTCDDKTSESVTPSEESSLSEESSDLNPSVLGVVPLDSARKSGIAEQLMIEAPISETKSLETSEEPLISDPVPETSTSETPFSKPSLKSPSSIQALHSTEPEGLSTEVQPIDSHELNLKSDLTNGHYEHIVSVANVSSVPDINSSFASSVKDVLEINTFADKDKVPESIFSDSDATSNVIEPVSATTLSEVASNHISQKTEIASTEPNSSSEESCVVSSSNSSALEEPVVSSQQSTPNVSGCESPLRKRGRPVIYTEDDSPPASPSKKRGRPRKKQKKEINGEEDKNSASSSSNGNLQIKVDESLKKKENKTVINNAELPLAPATPSTGVDASLKCDNQVLCLPSTVISSIQGSETSLRKRGRPIRYIEEDSPPVSPGRGSTSQPGGTLRSTTQPGGTPRSTTQPGGTPRSTTQPGGTPKSSTQSGEASPKRKRGRPKKNKNEENEEKGLKENNDMNDMKMEDLGTNKAKDDPSVPSNTNEVATTVLNSEFKTDEPVNGPEDQILNSNSKKKTGNESSVRKRGRPARFNQQDSPSEIKSRSPVPENKVKKKQGRPVNKKEEGKGKKEEEVQKSNPSNGASKKTGKSVKKEVKEPLEKDLTDDEEIVVNKDERLALKQIAEFLQKAKLPLSPFPVTKGDGNCWYRAMSDQVSMLGIPNKPSKHWDMRKQVADFLKNLPSDVKKNTIDIVFLGKPRGLSDLAHRQRKEGQWVDDRGVMVLATALFLRRNINIYSCPADDSRDYSVTKIEGGEGADMFPPLNVFYDNNHYQSLKLNKE